MWGGVSIRAEVVCIEEIKNEQPALIAYWLFVVVFIPLYALAYSTQASNAGDRS